MSTSQDGPLGSRDAYPFEFSTDVPKNTPSDSPKKTKRDMPWDGRLLTLTVGWPDGANGLVGVQFRTESGERYFPRNREDEYIAANDFTHPFAIRADISRNDVLVAEFINNDTDNDHFVNVVATVEERQ